jgi:hypothetical protein
MRFLGLMLLGALGLGGCAKSPVLDDNDLPQAASEYVTLFNHLDSWDESRAAALFASPTRALRQREHMNWMHARVGDCGAMQPVWQKGIKQARFSFTCERGGMEFSLRLDDTGKVAALLGGVTGVAPSPAVAAAFDEVIAAMPWQADGAGKQPWGDGIKRRWVRARGRCELERVRTVTERIGMFDLRCERGNMILRVSVKPDGSISLVTPWLPEQDEARAFRLKPTG